MDAEITDVARGDHARDLAGDATDARLQRAPVVDELHRVLRDLPFCFRRLRVREIQRCTVGVHEDVDLVQRETVRVVGLGSERAGEMFADLHDQQPVGIGARHVQFVNGRARMQGEADAPVLRHGRRRGHHARCEMPQHRFEPAEVGRNEVDIRAGIAEEALARAEEATAVVHTLAHEQLVQIGKEGTEHLETSEVIAFTESMEETAGNARSEGDGECVGRTDRRHRLVHVCEVHGGPFRKRAREQEGPH